LLEYGADVNSPPVKDFGATALQFAAINGYLGIAYRILVEHEADVNAPSVEREGERHWKEQQSMAGLIWLNFSSTPEKSDEDGHDHGQCR
jgi:hypothetical protein